MSKGWIGIEKKGGRSCGRMNWKKRHQPYRYQLTWSVHEFDPSGGQPCVVCPKVPHYRQPSLHSCLDLINICFAPILISYDRSPQMTTGIMRWIAPRARLIRMRACRAKPFSPSAPAAVQHTVRTFAKVRHPEGIEAGEWFSASGPSPLPVEHKGENGKPPDERTLKLGKSEYESIFGRA